MNDSLRLSLTALKIMSNILSNAEISRAVIVGLLRFGRRVLEKVFDVWMLRGPKPPTAGSLSTPSKMWSHAVTVSFVSLEAGLNII